MIRGLITHQGMKYRVTEKISSLILEEINGKSAKDAEYLELIEAVINHKQKRVFHLQRIAMDSKDEKIFGALLYNLESFLADAHKKSMKSTSVKDRKVIFWGMSDVQSLVNQIVEGN
jgi:ribosomal protein L22